MRAALRTGILTGLAVVIAATCMGCAAASGSAQSAATQSAATGSAATAPATTEPAVQWRITEHAGLGEELSPDDPAVLAREIYPGTTLEQLDFSDGEVEWALHQKPMGDAASVIEEQFADEYAYAHFGPAARTFTIAFDGTAPAGAFALLDATGLPYTSIENVGFTDSEYQAAARAVTKQVQAKLIAGAGFSISPDPTITPGAITVAIDGDDAATRQRMLDELGTITVEAPFSVTVVEGGEIPVMG